MIEAIRQPHPNPPGARWSVAVAAVLAVSAALYVPALGGMPAWDDDALIGGAGVGAGARPVDCLVRPFLGGYFRPVTALSFWLDRALFGGTPFFFHQTNLLIHVLTTAAVIGLLATAFRSRRAALAGGLLFAVQPAQVSTVAWIGGRTDSLCALWLALFGWSLIAGLRSEGRRGFWLLGASAAAFGAALFTKEQSLAVLPLVPLAVTCFPGPRARGTGAKRWTPCVPFAAMSAAFVAAWVAAWPVSQAPMLHPAGEQLGIAGRTIVYYTLLLVAPVPADMHSTTLGLVDRVLPWPALTGGVMLAATGLLFWRLLRSSPPAAWFLALTVLALAPVLNVVPLGAMLVAPWRAGTAGLGAAGLLGWAVCEAAGRASAWRRPALMAAVSAAIAYCAVLSAWGVRQWQDLHTISAAFVREDPDSLLARANLSTALFREGRYAGARRNTEEVLQRLFGGGAWRDPHRAALALAGDPAIAARIEESQDNRLEARGWLGRLYSQLGAACLAGGDLTAAERALATGGTFDPAEPDLNAGLAACAQRRGDWGRAARLLRVAVAADPTAPDTHRALGLALLKLGRPREACGELQASVRRQPWLAAVYLDLAEAQARAGDRAAARATLAAARRCTVGDPEGVARLLARLDGRGRRSEGARAPAGGGADGARAPDAPVHEGPPSGISSS